MISYPPAIDQGATVIVHAREGPWRHAHYGEKAVVGAAVPCVNGGFDYLVVFPGTGESDWVHGSCLVSYRKRASDTTPPPRPLKARVTVANALKSSVARMPPGARKTIEKAGRDRVY